MGDRISISFKNGNRESVWIYSHWGGQGFLDVAKEFMDGLIEKQDQEENPHIITPLDRCEVEYIVPAFVMFIAAKHPEERDIHICDAGDGDDSDNGHFTCNVRTGEWRHTS